MSTFYFFQILPEKYCYHRKVEDSTNQPIDCVICMTTIDLTQRTSEYMVNCEIFLAFHFAGSFYWLLTVLPPTGGALRAYISLRLFTTLDGHQDGVPNLQALPTASLDEALYHIVNKR